MSTNSVPYYKYDPDGPVERALEEGRKKGWFRIVRRTKKHGPVYELTKKGIAFVDSLPHER